MMGLNKKQKKYLRDHCRHQSLEEIANSLGVSQNDLRLYLEKIWRPEKLRRFLSSQAKKIQTPSLLTKIKNFSLKRFYQENQSFILLLLFLGIAVYFNSLNNEFLSDDIAAIAQNKDLDKISLVINSFPVAFRPFLYYVINFLFGRSPIAFRVLNLFFHLLGGVGLLALTSLLLDRTTAIIASLIFIVHPLLVESVTWISGGGYSQYGALLIWALVFYLLSFKEKKYFYFSLGAFLLALGSSEKAMAWPFLVLVLVITHWPDLGKEGAWKKLIIPLLIGLAWIGFYLTKVPERVNDLETSYYQASETMPSFFRKVPIGIISYISLIFWPHNLTLYHSEVHLYGTEFVTKLILFILYLGLTAYLFLSKSSQNRRLSFWLIWPIVSLAPVLSPFGVSWLVAERYVYFASAGVIILAGYLFALLFKRKKTAVWGIALVVTIIIGLSVKTILRNIDWKNQDNLWLSAQKTSPNSPQNHNNLGDLYARRKDFDQAIKEFQTAILLNPNYADAYHNLANIYQQKGDLEQALKFYQKAAEINPNIWQTHQNMAAIYFERGQFDLSLVSALKVLKLNPENESINRNLGLIYLNLGQNEEAQKYLQAALSKNPQDKEIQRLLLDL